MEHSTNSASLSFRNSRSQEKPYDWTILTTGVCVVVGAIVAIYAVTVSGAVDPNDLATVVAFP
jgi:hypothetical protein